MTEAQKGRKRIDHSGETYGSVSVLGRHPLNQRHWEIRWGCCGREQEVSAERLAVIVRTLPARCSSCVREDAQNNPDYYSPSAVRNRDLLAARKAMENRAAESRQLAVKDLRGYVWQELGKLGPRYG